MNASITLRNNRIVLRVPYSPIVVERLRTIPGWHFNYYGDKTWDFPVVRDCLMMLADICGVFPHQLPPELRGILDERGLEPLPVHRELIEGHHFLTEPYEHQRDNLARLLEHPRWLLADECGTGKSHPICNLLEILIHHTPISDRLLHILIICPKSVLKSWQDQLQRHAMIRGQIVGGTKADREGILNNINQIKITNFEQLLYNDFSKYQWDVIVFDEIHRLKNFTGAISRAARELSRKATYVYGLSGTPAPNGLQDWHGVLAALDPDRVPWKTKKAFEESHVYRTRLGGDGPFVIAGYRNTNDLRRVIRNYCSRVTKAEAIDLPEKVFSTRAVQLQGEQKRVYNELRKDAVTRLGELEKARTLTVANVLTESLRLAQIVGGFVPDDDGEVHELTEKAKLDALADVLDEIGERQAVIWCAFKPEVRFLRSWLKQKYNCECSVLTGDITSATLRQEEINRFMRGESRFFVGTAAAGGTGVNGLEVADTAIFYSRNFNLVDYMQAQDRTHRIGTKSAVTIYNLIAERTIDEKIDLALERKASLQEMMMGSRVEKLL